MKRCLLIVIIGIVILCVGCVAHPRSTSTPTPEHMNGTFDVLFIDVGQGDSELLMLDNLTMLVDAGPDNDATNVTRELKKFGVDHINYVVMTHPHADHIDGMLALFAKYSIGEVIDSGYAHTTATYTNTLHDIDQRNIKYVVAYDGMTIPFGDADVEVVHTDKSATDPNDASIVLKVVHNHSLLLTGDATGNVEMDFAQHVDVLKVAHHGSKYATSQSFLNIVKPSISIISVGLHNDYGHPAPETVTRLRSVSTVYQTRYDGSVLLNLDNLTVTTHQ